MQHGKDVAYPLYKFRADFSAVSIFNKTQQSTMLNAPKMHMNKCTV